MIYFDNAATSFPKPHSVINEVTKCLKHYCGNPGRSSHRLSLRAADKIFETRETIASFLSYGKSENVVFIPSATYALNLAIKGLIRERCHCIISDLEHNSVVRPLYKTIEKYGGSVSVFDSDLPIDEAITPLLRDNTKFIISTLCSNVTGKIINFNDLSSFAKKRNIKLIIDASQYIGHARLDLHNSYFTVICCAGHKNLFGIQGSAFAIINDTRMFDTFVEGGSGIDTFSIKMPDLLPERYEAGTLSTPAIVSLNAGIKYIEDIGINNVETHLANLTSMLTDELSSMKKIKIYGAYNGIAAFNIGDISSSIIAKRLDEHEICIRSGFHCSPLIHKKMKTNDQGALRVSFSYFNKESEIMQLVHFLKQI